MAALAADRRGSRAELAALTAASAVAASGVPGEASAAEASAVPEAVFGWAAGDGSQDPEAAPAAGSALPGSISMQPLVTIVVFTYFE